MAISFEEQRRNMIESQVRTNDVSDAALINAISKCAREDFVNADGKKFAYAEVEVKSNSGRQIMKVRDFSKLAQAALVNPKEEVLIIAGSAGYSAKIFEMMGAKVTIADSVEIDGQNSVKTDIATLDGVSDNSFDLIFVDGGVETVPQIWFKKLKENGRLALINYLTNVGVAQIYVKTGDVVGSKNYFEAKPPKLPELNKKLEFSL